MEYDSNDIIIGTTGVIPSSKTIIYQSELHRPMLVYDIDEAYKDGLRVAQYLNNYNLTGNDDIYNEWLSIFEQRNKDYGTSAWMNLGLKFLYSIIYTKCMRFNNCHSFDSLIDIFGYCVLGLMYCNKIYDCSDLLSNYNMSSYNYKIDFLLNEGYRSLWLADEVSIRQAWKFFIEIYIAALLEYEKGDNFNG